MDQWHLINNKVGSIDFLTAILEDVGGITTGVESPYIFRTVTVRII